MIRLSNIRISKDREECIDNCTACHDACLELIDHCLRQGGRQADPDNIKLIEDCAEICQTTVNFMVRESSRHPLTCAVATVISEECARVLASFPDDEMMSQCAEICRRCAKSCRSMAWRVHPA